MPVARITRNQEALTIMEAWELAGFYHGLLVYGLEGPDGESVTKLARTIGEQPHLRGRDADMVCKLWVGDTFPYPRESWHLVFAQLIECEPTMSYAVHLQHYNVQTFQLGGCLIDPSSTGDRHVVLFRGKYSVVYSLAGRAESEVGYIKTSLLM